METTADPNEEDYISDHTSGAWSNKSKAIFIVNLDDGTVLDKVVFDSTDTAGHSTMKYAIARRTSPRSTP